MKKHKTLRLIQKEIERAKFQKPPVEGFLLDNRHHLFNGHPTNLKIPYNYTQPPTLSPGRYYGKIYRTDWYQTTCFEGNTHRQCNILRLSASLKKAYDPAAEQSERYPSVIHQDFDYEPYSEDPRIRDFAWHKIMQLADAIGDDASDSTSPWGSYKREDIYLNRIFNENLTVIVYQENEFRYDFQSPKHDPHTERYP